MQTNVKKAIGDKVCTCEIVYLDMNNNTILIISSFYLVFLHFL